MAAGQGRFPTGHDGGIGLRPAGTGGARRPLAFNEHSHASTATPDPGSASRARRFLSRANAYGIAGAGVDGFEPGYRQEEEPDERCENHAEAAARAAMAQ